MLTLHTLCCARSSCLTRIPLIPLPPRIAISRKLNISSWTKKQTTSWLSNVTTLEKNDKKLWDSLHMDGESLPFLTSDLLMKCGMAAGPSLKIVSHIQNLLDLGINGVSPTRANSLLNFIINNTELQQFFKKDPSVPTKLARNRAKFACVGRQDAFREAYAAMATRLHLREEDPVMAKERQANNLPAMIATTGGGKSFFLDEIGSLREEDLQLCEDSAMKEILKHTVAVAITHNSGFPITESIDNNPNRRCLGLAVRALYSYFTKTEKLSFAHFVDILKPVSHNLDLKCAVQCIAAHSGKGVLLLVDELMKTAKCEQNNVDNVVSQICICLDGFSSAQFNVVVSTLNIGPLVSAMRTSGRRISWIKLQRAKLADAKFLFGEDSNHYSTLAQCIADCNGHYRSLETLKILWDKNKSKHWSYSQLITALGNQLEEKYSSLEVPHIRAALLGTPVQFDAKVPGLNHTFADCLEMGFFINTPGKQLSMDKYTIKDTPRLFVPIVSPLQLMLFANNHAGDSSGSETYLYSRAISSMLELELNFTWQQYEKFHAHWETLIRLVHGSASPQTMQNLYRGTLSETSQDPKFYLSRKSHELYSWPTHFPQKYSKNATLPTFRKGALTKHMIMPAINNPGFDIVTFEKQRNSKSEAIIICTECRFSDPASATSLDKAAIAQKRELTVSQFRPYFEGKKLDGVLIKESNLFLVVCAFREVNDNAFKDLPANTIVLNRDMLKTLYSPSLASRPQFILPLEEGESTQVPE